MGIDAASPEELWTEALNTACYITNRFRLKDQNAPIVAWRKQLNMRTPDNATLSFLRAWYAKAYVIYLRKSRSKPGIGSQSLDQPSSRLRRRQWSCPSHFIFMARLQIRRCVVATWASASAPLVPTIAYAPTLWTRVIGPMALSLKACIQTSEE